MRPQPLVLLVDDEEQFLEIASLKLRPLGFEIAAANGGREAFEKAAELRPDLVLSDVYMSPGPNGWELALELRRDPRTRDIKLAFFTSLSDPWREIPPGERRAVASELGPVAVLSKTADIECLADRVKSLLS